MTDSQPSQTDNMPENPYDAPATSPQPGDLFRSRLKLVRYFTASIFAAAPIALAIRSVRSYNAFVETLPDDAYVSGTPIAVALAGATILVPFFAIIEFAVGFICEN